MVKAVNFYSKLTKKPQWHAIPKRNNELNVLKNYISARNLYDLEIVENVSRGILMQKKQHANDICLQFEQRNVHKFQYLHIKYSKQLRNIPQWP